MKKIITAALLVAVIMLSGCLSALHPIFTEADLVFDAGLIGSWKTKADADESAVQNDAKVITFEKGNANSFATLPEPLKKLAHKAYLLTIKDQSSQKETARYYAFLARIGQNLYLDYFPSLTKEQQGYPEEYTAHFLPMHSFYQLKKGKASDNITIQQFGDGYLKKLIDDKKIRIRHEVKMDGTYVITAPTEELQQYILKYGNVDEAYENNETYTRIK